MNTLDIEKLYGNDAATVRIAPPNQNGVGTTKPYKGLIETEFGFDLAPQWTDGSESGQGMQKVSDAYNAVKTTAGFGSQTILKSITQTLSQWNGIGKPTFNVPLTLVNYNAQQNVMKTVQELAGLASPEFQGLEIVAPNGYQAEKLGNYLSGGNNAAFAASIRGTWTLEISTWFRAPLLLLTHFSFTASKEIVRTLNQPLYARCQLSFMPAVLPDKRAIQQYFLV